MSTLTAQLARGIVVGLLALACAEPCETGETCPRSCPVGGQAICAAHGLCACLRGPDGGAAQPDALVSDGIHGADPTARSDGGPPVAAGCRAPAPGDVVINELMLDGEPTEEGEFVELVNRRMAPIDLAGVVLTSNRGVEQVRRVEFIGGCLPAGSAVALFADRAAWVESAPATPPIEAELRSFGFANSGDFDFRLMRGDAVLDRLQGSGDIIAPGVSVNRSPDLQGSPLSHPALDPRGSASSPARCPDGGRYEDGCPPPEPDPDAPADTGPADAGPAESDGGAADAGPDFDCPSPAPGELRMNEILIDGRVARTEADEFIEIVNIAAEPRRLRGLTVAVELPDVLEPRVVFGDGCLPGLGAMVLRPDLADWAFEPPIAPLPQIVDARLALGNESRSPVVLFGPDGLTHDRLDPGLLDIVEGVSLNRSPELDGAEWRLHDRMSDQPTSPGTCVDGSAFTPSGCPEPESPMRQDCVAADETTLVVNEVLIDGAEAREVDEFIELVNKGPAPVALAGLGLWSSRADGLLVERVLFERGCLDPGALAIFGARDDWMGRAAGLVAQVDRLALPNDAPLLIELRTPAHAWAVAVPQIATAPGVSLVREVEGDPEAPWVAHDVRSALVASPGTRSDGQPFAPGAPREAP